MKRDKDDWLDQKITEELLAMADEREKELMEMEELQDIDMPIEKFEDIKREAERRRRKSRRGILRPRTAIIAAALLALLLGVGVVTVGSREYRPEIIEREQGLRLQRGLIIRKMQLPVRMMKKRCVRRLRRSWG